jgi:hypothetical protein
VTHRDAVVDRDRIELYAPATCGIDHLLYALADVVQVHVAGYELRKTVGDRDDGLFEIRILHAGGSPQGAGSRHVATGG